MAISNDPTIEHFISEHRWAVLTVLRASGAPVSAMLAYARDGDELVLSTSQTTFRVAAIERDARVNLCIISNNEPFNFVSIEGACSVEHDDLVRRTRLVFARIGDIGYPEPPDLAAWIRDDQRVVLRVVPERIHAVIR